MFLWLARHLMISEEQKWPGDKSIFCFAAFWRAYMHVCVSACTRTEMHVHKAKSFTGLRLQSKHPCLSFDFWKQEIWMLAPEYQNITALLQCKIYFFNYDLLCQWLLHEVTFRCFMFHIYLNNHCVFQNIFSETLCTSNKILVFEQVHLIIAI